MGPKCCKALDHAMALWDRPFYYPTYIDPETKSLRSDRLCLQLFDVTRAGRQRNGQLSWATVQFCPFCGTRLVGENVPMPSPGPGDVAATVGE